MAPASARFEVGKSADLVLLDWKQIPYPNLDEETPLLDAVIQRAKAEEYRGTLVWWTRHLLG